MVGGSRLQALSRRKSLENLPCQVRLRRLTRGFTSSASDRRGGELLPREIIDNRRNAVPLNSDHMVVPHNCPSRVLWQMLGHNGDLQAAQEGAIQQDMRSIGFTAWTSRAESPDDDMPPLSRTHLSLVIRDENNIQLFAVVMYPGECLAKLIYVLLTVVRGEKELLQMHDCSWSRAPAYSSMPAGHRHDCKHSEQTESPQEQPAPCICS